MASGADHYLEAERLAARAANFHGEPSTAEIHYGQLAQAHATLALAAATALTTYGPDSGLPFRDYDQWHKHAAVPAGTTSGEQEL